MTETPIASGEITHGEVNQNEVDVLANQYAEYLHVDVDQQVQHFEDSIEELLTRLDEYHGLLDMIRSDTSLCLQKNLPLIKAKNAEIEKMFHRIDKLEAFVTVVKKNVNIMEAQVEKAEAQLGSFSGIRKIFNSIPLPSLFGAKKSSPVRTVPQYTTPDIFKTKDFITTHQSKEPDSKSLKTRKSPSKSADPIQHSISSSGDHSNHTEVTSIQTDPSHDFHNIPEGDSQSKTTSAESLNQSDSGFQSPVHLNDNDDVKCKNQVVQS